MDIGQIENLLASEWEGISSAPITFLAAFVVALVGAIVLIRSHYKFRLEVRDDIIRLLEKEIALIKRRQTFLNKTVQGKDS